jgi:hypothetical protein
LVKQNRDLKASMNADPDRPEEIKPGTTVPALEGKNLSEGAFTISFGADRRKTALLSFLPQCSFCDKNMPNWKAIIKDIDKKLSALPPFS